MKTYKSRKMLKYVIIILYSGIKMAKGQCTANYSCSGTTDTFYFSRNGGKSPLHTLLLTWMTVFICQVGMAQDHSDADRIKSAHYMLHAHKSDCDSLDGNNAQLKICLNFEFQQVDSILNERFMRYLNEIENDSIRKSIVQYQQAWVINRRSVSSLESEGYVGHWVSISFLSSMLFITRKRIEELEYLIKSK